MTPCLCKKSIAIHDTMCYNIDTVKERNTIKDPLQDHQVSRLHFENRPTKSKKGVEKSTIKNLVDLCRVMWHLVFA